MFIPRLTEFGSSLGPKQVKRKYVKKYLGGEMGSAADKEQPGVKRNILIVTDLLDVYLCGR